MKAPSQLSVTDWQTLAVARLMKHLRALGKDLELRVTDAPPTRDLGQLKVVG